MATIHTKPMTGVKTISFVAPYKPIMCGIADYTDFVTQESLLHRFQRMVQTSGILREVKANRHFVSWSEAARIKSKKNAQRRRQQGI